MRLLWIWLACHAPASSQKMSKESVFSPDSATTTESRPTESDSPTESPTDSPSDSPTDSGPRLTTLPDHISAQGLILVQVDALRADHLGVYGYGRDTTPTLSSENWLRMEGVSSTASWTPLSVSSLMTSLPPYQHGVRYFNTSTNALNALLTAPRWSDALQAAGISTFLATGSYFFDVSTGIGGGFSAVSTSDKHYPTNHLDTQIPTVLDWLTALPPDAPFFVVLHAMNAHDPYFSTEETANTWTDPRLLPFGQEVDPMTQSEQIRGAYQRDPTGTRQKVIDLYDEEVLGLDRALSRLEQGLSERGFLDRSLLVFTADHGETLGDRNSGTFGHGESLPQEQIRLPWMLRHPEISPGLLNCTASNMDTIPTLIHLMGWSVPPLGEGQALQNGCRRISTSELYNWSGMLTYLSAANTDYRLNRDCISGQETALDLRSAPDGTVSIDPTTIPEIADLRSAMDTHAAAILAQLQTPCHAPP